MKLTQRQKQMIHDAIDSAWYNTRSMDLDERFELIHIRVDNAMKRLEKYEKRTT